MSCVWLASRGILAVLLTASRNFYGGLHLNVYELIWFELSVMIDTIDLHILIIAQMTLALNQGLWSAKRKQTFLHQLSHKFLNRFRFNWVYC